MNSTKILPPHIPYTLPCSFGAIDHAKIFIGQYGTDPTVVANRIPIYIMDINGKMTRVEQPIITNSAGQSMYNDIPTNFYCFDRYSIMVQNNYGDKLYFEMVPGGEFGIPARFDFRTGGTVTTHDMVVFHPAAPGNNHYYFWEGALPKTVPANSAPTPLGPGQWVDVALRLTQDGFDDDYDNLLRFELGANSGATLVGTSTGENVEERITNLTPEDIGAQPVDATLTAMAGVVTAADKIIYFDGVDTAKSTTLTGFGRSLIDDANAAAARATIGAQPLDATLTAVAGVVTAADKIIYFDGVDTALSTTLTGFGRSLIDDANAAAARTTLGAQAADATLTAIAGVVTAADKIIYFDGVDTAKTTTLTGFGRSLIDDADAATARATLGAQPLDATLTAMAGVTTAADRIIYFNGVDLAAATPLTEFGRSLIDDADATAGRATLGAAATVHTHAVGDITGLQGALDGKLSLTGGTLTGDLIVDNSNIKLINDMGSVLSISASRDDFETWAIETSPSDGYGLMISAADDSTHIAMSTVLGAEFNDIVIKGRLKNTGQFTEYEDPNAYATLDAMDRYITQNTLRLSGGNLTGGLGIYTVNPYLILDATSANETSSVWGTIAQSTEFSWALGKLDPASTAITVSNESSGTKLVLDDGFISVVGGDIRQVAPQGTDPSSLSRRDFVETNFVNKAGDVMTGGLQALNFQARDIEQGMQGIRIGGGADYSEVIPVDSAGSVLWTESLRYLPDTGKWTTQVQGTEPSSLTTKQYVDDAIAAGGGGGGTGDYLPLTGGTLTGDLFIEGFAGDMITLNSTSDSGNALTSIKFKGDGVTRAVITADEFSGLGLHVYKLDNQSLANSLKIYEGYAEFTRDPRVEIQGSAPESLTRRDFIQNHGLTTATAKVITDCNTTAAIGAYGGWYATSTTTTNGPYASGDGKLNNALLLNLSKDTNVKAQLFFTTDTSDELWIRSSMYSGSKKWTTWKKVFPAAGGGGSTTLGGLTDVADDIATVALEGDVLSYDATALQWVPRAPAAGGSGGMTFTELGDAVDLNTITTPGFYIQRSKSEMQSGSNYPTAPDYSGTLAVYHIPSHTYDVNPEEPSGILQIFYAGAAGTVKHYVRQYNNDFGEYQWSGWYMMFNENVPPNLSQVGAFVHGLGTENSEVLYDCSDSLALKGGWHTVSPSAVNAPYPAEDTKLNGASLVTFSVTALSLAQLFFCTSTTEMWIRTAFSPAGGTPLAWSEWAQIFPSAVTLGDVDALRVENQSLRDRVDALEQLVNQILGVG